MIRDSARGSPPSQDDLINLAVAMNDGQASLGQPPAVELSAPGIVGSVQYSASRSGITTEEGREVLIRLQKLMVDNRIVVLSAALDPWANRPRA